MPDPSQHPRFYNDDREWTMYEDDGLGLYEVRANIGGKRIVLAYQLERNEASLIAAAPRMLELLRRAHSRISDDHGIDHPLARDIYDAIMEATSGRA